MRRLAPGLLLLAVFSASWIPTADAATSKLDPRVRRALAMVRSGASLETLRLKEASVSATRELEVFISGDVDRGELEAAGARVRTALPGVFTASIPEGAIDRVAALTGVRRIVGASPVKTSLDVSVPSTGADDARGPAPTFTGLNGENVLVGVVDTGVDYDHGDFQNQDGTTRLINIWDQTGVGVPPAGFGYGAEWDAASIDNNSSTEIDDNGHGTHVLGIAGGDGSQTGGSVPAFTYVGMAPRADLMMVKTNFQTTGVVDAVDYIMGRATDLGKNAVVNLSLGSLFGPKDGTSEFDTAISALTGPGKIVVVAAGNAGNSPVHAEFVAAGASGTITMNVGSTQPGGFVAIDGYYSSFATPLIRITTPQGATIGPIAVGAMNAAYPGTLTGAGHVYVENGVATAPNGDKQVYFEVNVPNPAAGASPLGTWTFQFLQPGVGVGHDETTEAHNAGQWGAAAAATPGTVAGGVSGDHLLITEIGWRGLNSVMQTDSTEFIEIHNPTASAIDLTNFYLSDVNAYQELPVSGTVNLASVNTDFAMKFPDGASIPAGGVRVIAADGGRYKRGTGVDADFMIANAGGITTAQLMVDKGQHGGVYPAFGLFTNGGEFVWLFQWDGLADLVCDVDFVYYGSGTGGNVPALKGGVCQDGPDAGSGTTCYALDNGNPAGTFGSGLSVPANGAGTRQRTGAEGAEASAGNGCGDGGGDGGVAAGIPDAEVDLWIFVASELASFVMNADPTSELVDRTRHRGRRRHRRRLDRQDQLDRLRKPQHQLRRGAGDRRNRRLLGSGSDSRRAAEARHRGAGIRRRVRADARRHDHLPAGRRQPVSERWRAAHDRGRHQHGGAARRRRGRAPAAEIRRHDPRRREDVPRRPRAHRRLHRRGVEQRMGQRQAQLGRPGRSGDPAHRSQRRRAAHHRHFVPDHVDGERQHLGDRRGHRDLAGQRILVGGRRHQPAQHRLLQLDGDRADQRDRASQGDRQGSRHQRGRRFERCRLRDRGADRRAHDLDHRLRAGVRQRAAFARAGRGGVRRAARGRRASGRVRRRGAQYRGPGERSSRPGTLSGHVRRRNPAPGGVVLREDERAGENDHQAARDAAVAHLGFLEAAARASRARLELGERSTASSSTASPTADFPGWPSSVCPTAIIPASLMT